MQAGWVETAGAIAGRMAPPLILAAGEATGNGKSSTQPSGGFTAMLGALTSEQMAQFNLAPGLSQQGAALTQSALVDLEVSVPGAERDIAGGMPRTGEDADLSQSLACDGASRALHRELPCDVPPSTSNVAATAKNSESPSSQASRKEPNPEKSMGKQGSADAPSPASPATLDDPSVPVIPSTPLPPLADAAPAEKPSIHSAGPRSTLPAAVAGLTNHRPGAIVAPAAGHRSTTGPSLQKASASTSVMESSVTLVSGTPQIEVQGGRSGAMVSVPVPLRKNVKQPGIVLQDGHVSMSSDATAESAETRKASAPLAAQAPELKSAQPAHREVGMVMEAAAKDIAGEPTPLHTSPAGASYGANSTGAEIGRGAFQPANNGAPATDRNPFQRLDSLVPDPSLHLRLRPNVIEAGLESASYGWIEVKATSSAGLVSASIHATAAAAAPVIQSHLQELSSILSEQAIPMREVTVGAELAGGNREGSNGHPRGNEERHAEPGTTRAPTATAATGPPDLTPSSMISVHA